MKLPRFNEKDYAHFITTNTFKYKNIFYNHNCCLILLKNIDFYRNKLGFKLIGYVIIPNHLHAIIWWPTKKCPELTISKIMQSIKSHSARQIIDYLHRTGSRGPLNSANNRSSGQGTRTTPEEYPHKRMSNQKYQIWQPSFYDFNIYSEKKLKQKLDYIHNNPVRTRLVKNASNYKYSSYRNYYMDDDKLIKIDKINI